MGIFSRFKEKRRERIIASHAIDDAVWARVLKDHPIFRGLSGDETRRLRDFTTLFLVEKQILFRTDMKDEPYTALSIAAQACLPVVNIGFDWLSGWRTVYVVPKEFEHSDYSEVGENAWVTHEDEVSGEVTAIGSIALSLPDVEDSGWGEGYNVVIHEIAHKLDERDGHFDGRPPLPREMSRDVWDTTLKAAFDDFCERLEKTGRKKKYKLPLDDYAGDSIEEFFAVAAEAFFETPVRLRNAYAELYAQFAAFFKQNPADREH